MRSALLSDLLLGRYDRLLKEALEDSSILRMIRYVDDFFIVHKASASGLQNDVEKLYKVFAGTLKYFTLTMELPEDSQLRFLDLRLFIRPKHIYWCYSPRSNKRLMPYSSPHSKLVKRLIATSGLKNALNRSCHHCIEETFKSPLQRLRALGFPDDILRSVCEKIFTRFPPKSKQKLL